MCSAGTLQRGPLRRCGSLPDPPLPLILFVSDIHFGRGDRASERAKEAALLACLRAHADRAEHLYLVGDVFDAFIEYRTMVPKGFVRFQALLAEWTDAGTPVTYLVGNHDPWHLDYFTSELGVRVVHRPCTARLYGRRVHLHHGDGIDPAERSYRLLKPLLRHPVAGRLYRALLPGDTGLRLARRISRNGDDELEASKATALRAYALGMLATDAVDVVLMGHSHQPERIDADGGTYVNLGSWAHERTFAVLDEDGPNLLRWNGACAVPVDGDVQERAPSSSLSSPSQG